MDRPSKRTYYMDIAKTVSTRSTCLRRHYGACIVNNDEIVATGYNGAPRGCDDCLDKGYCWRAEHKIPRGTRYELCASVHGEANAIISAGRKNCLGGTMYIYGYDVASQDMVHDPDSCQMCKRMIINSGIDEVIFADDYNAKDGEYEFRRVKVSTWVESGAAEPNPEGY